MRLLIITQQVDRDAPVLGFFHGWIAGFAAHADRVTVIGQTVGTHALPPNVRVLSLGKEKRRPVFLQVFHFWRLIMRERAQYDRVFVHMTPVWVLLGWSVWVLLRKPVYLWYEARGGGWMLPLSLRLVRKVFGATPHGLPVPSPKHVVAGHGIDTSQFRPGEGAREKLIVAVGRITPVKHYALVLRAFAALSPEYRLRIAGGTFTENDHAELERLQILMRDLDIVDRVDIGWIPSREMPRLLQRAELLLHACAGGLDKALLEAMACECLVMTTSEAARGELPDSCLANPADFVDHALRIIALSEEEKAAVRRDLRSRVLARHGLSRLMERLASDMR